jgi:hypothetical protein
MGDRNEPKGMYGWRCFIVRQRILSEHCFED